MFFDIEENNVIEVIRIIVHEYIRGKTRNRRGNLFIFEIEMCEPAEIVHTDFCVYIDVNGVNIKRFTSFYTC